jgi:hypothetical protein
LINLKNGLIICKQLFNWIIQILFPGLIGIKKSLLWNLSRLIKKLKIFQRYFRKKWKWYFLIMIVYPNNNCRIKLSSNSFNFMWIKYYQSSNSLFNSIPCTIL